MRIASWSRIILESSVSRFRLAIVLCLSLASAARASVIVVTNRTRAAVSFRLELEPATVSHSRDFTLDAGDCIPIPLFGPAQMCFDSAGQAKKYQVFPQGLFYFGQTGDGQIDVGQIGLSATEVVSDDKPRAAVVSRIENAAVSPQPIVVIPIKILFDDAEVTPRAIWEARLQKRFNEVSRLFKKYCFVEFQIVAVESWHSDASITQLDKALKEFERQVDSAPARLAIGFTAQQRQKLQDQHLGGTRGPLHTHLLVRERVNKNTERECLEVLVHELGHFLGAVHSPEQNSVMRPVLGDRYARSTRFRIVFDPLNTMAMSLVSQALVTQPDLRFGQLPSTTQDELRRLYIDLARARPDDPAAPIYLRMLGGNHPSLPALR
jgi:hypothetical protein